MKSFAKTLALLILLWPVIVAAVVILGIFGIVYPEMFEETQPSDMGWA